MSICTMDQNILNIIRIILERSIQAEMVFFRQCIKDCSCKTALICAGLPAHDHNSSLRNTQRFIRNHQINIKFHLISQTKTIRAGSKRIIKRKASRLYLINTDLTIRAGKALTECLHSTIHRIYHKQPIRKIQNCLNGIRQSFLDSRFYYQTVYDNFYIMFDVFIQFNFFRQLIQISINLYTYITAAFRLIQKLCMCPLSTTNYRCQKLQLCSFRKCHNMINHLIDCLLFDFLSALRTMRNTNTCIKKSEIVINFCNCSNR